MVSSDPMTGRKVLVTGASGFLGRRTVQVLARQGWSVRCLVRTKSRIAHLDLPDTEIHVGDVADPKTLEAAFEGIDAVVHAAADTSGSPEGGRLSTVEGTRNILELCARNSVKKLVYISSCSVYGPKAAAGPETVDEESALEPFPEKRGAYSRSKFEAEKLVLRFMAENRVPVICLRPGTIYGPGGSLYTPMLGFSLGGRIFVVIDTPGFVLPLVYLDNMAAAITACLKSNGISGRIYNVVDPERITKRLFMEKIVRKIHPRSMVLYLPYKLLFGLTRAQEKAFAIFGREPVLSTYRLIASQSPVVFDADRIRRELGWEPPVSFAEAAEKIVNYAPTG